MQVIAVEGDVAVCLEGEHRHSIDVCLVAPVAVGEWLLTFLGAARAKLQAQEALAMCDALKGLEAVMAGDDVEPYFADLIDRAPQLPPHMQSALMAGKSTA
jgi:hydrogenase expression/formation protein HypC